MESLKKYARQYGLQDSVRPPKVPEEWLNISRDSESKWNMPHCTGAIDGSM